MSNATMTNAEAIERFGIDIDAHFAAEDPIPVHTAGQFQGDVAIVPATILDYPVTPATTPVPPEGVAVVRGENGGNTHLLLCTPGVTFDARLSTTEPLLLGVLTVADGAEAYMGHPEHGYIGIGPGTYETRRQREQAEEERLVRD